MPETSYHTLADIRDLLKPRLKYTINSEEAVRSLLRYGIIAATGWTEQHSGTKGGKGAVVPIPVASWKDARIDWDANRISSKATGERYADVRILPTPLADLDAGIVHARHVYLYLDEAVACVGSSQQLARALAEGSLIAEGLPTPYEGSVSESPLRQQIPPQAFEKGEIYWKERRVVEHTTWRTPDPKRWRNPDPTRLIWEEVRIPRAELEQVFPSAAKPFERSDSEARRAGAPPKYDWDKFWIEVVSLCQEAIPPTQNAFIHLMEDRLAQVGWKKVPEESTIRKKLSPLCKRLDLPEK